MSANLDRQHGGQHQRDREQKVGPSSTGGLPHAGELLEVVQVASATADAR